MPDVHEDDIDLTGGEGLEETDALLHLKLGRSFLAGPHDATDIVRLRWYVRTHDGALVGRVYFGPGAQGPPGHAHGGSMAAVLDEALGSACWVAGHPVVAAELTTQFHRLLPINGVYTTEAWVEKTVGRKIYPRGRIVDEDGGVYASAHGLFVEMDLDRFEALADTDTPDS